MDKGEEVKQLIKEIRALIKTLRKDCEDLEVELRKRGLTLGPK